MFLSICFWLLVSVIVVLAVYTVRHYVFTVNRLFGRQRHPYVDVTLARWPSVTVLIPAHNEELVIEHILEALVNGDYPHESLTIVPVNDRSTDGTQGIMNEFAARYPRLVSPMQRTEGDGGKAAVLRAASERATGEIIIVFDADYVPGAGLLRQLVAPFFDPQVGAVMGRVVPHNAGNNLLTRMLDLERSAGYQVDQQARMNMHLVPQYGGTVGGVRSSALSSVGGWRSDTLTEDTDLTYRLLLRGWEIVYQNRSECYEEVPEDWPVRIRQIARWAEGHNQAFREHSSAVLRGDMRGFWQRIDAMLLLGVYGVAPLTLIGWVLALTLWYGGRSVSGWMAILTVASFSTVGNFAAFFEVAAAARLDGHNRRVRLLPFLLLGFLVSQMAIVRSLFTFKRRSHNGNGDALVHWNKTRRYGSVSASILANERAQ